MASSFRQSLVCLVALTGSIGADDVLGTEPATRPNFVLVLTDDQGWTSTSVSMHPEIQSESDYHRTPNLARLASSGMRFSQGYSPAGLCCPTRRSIQFGQTPLRQGDDDAFIQRYPVGNTRPTIPRLLKAIRHTLRGRALWQMGPAHTARAGTPRL